MVQELLIPSPHVDVSETRVSQTLVFSLFVLIFFSLYSLFFFRFPVLLHLNVVSYIENTQLVSGH